MPTYFSFPEHPLPAKDSSETRPNMIRNSKSFTRLDSSPARPTPLKTELQIPAEDGPDESLTSSPTSEDDRAMPLSEPLPEGFDDLPPEIVELTDKFLESLSQKTFPAPLNATQLSVLFQDFYLTAFDHVRTYISNLYISLTSRKRTSQNGTKVEQQMLSLSEISEKKKNRRLLTAKRQALEEAVERKVCEAVYDKIWRHKSTDDEARDETLRSKAQALDVIGVKLEHLGVSGVDDNEMIESLTSAREALLDMSKQKYPSAKLNILREVHKSIVDVLSSRNSDSSADRILPTLIFCLIHSSPEVTVISDLFFIQRFRASKAIEGEAAYCLTNLEAAISFVETVNLNTLKVEGLELDHKIKASGKQISCDNENFVSQENANATPNAAIDTSKQATAGRGRKPVRELSFNNDRSRSETPFVPANDPLSNLSEKLLSAKIDHSLKRAEEAWANELARSPSPTMTRFGPDVMKVTQEVAVSTTAASAIEATATIATRSRGLSYLTTPAADLAGTVVNTADAGFKTIGSTLENSYKFLFSKIDEKRTEVPRTLEDARKLVETPAHTQTVDGSISPESRLHRTGSKESLASKAGGTIATDKGVITAAGRNSPSAIINSINLPSAALGVVGNSLRGIAGINVMRPFNRSSTNLTNSEKEKETPIPQRNSSVPPQELTSQPATPPSSSPPVIDLLKVFPDLANPLLRSQSSMTTATLGSLVSEESMPPTPPPRPLGPLKLLPDLVDRFMNATDIGELKVNELQELLTEYKRLGAWVRGLGGVDS